MSEFPDDLPPVLAVLEPYLAELIVIGGWVPELYRRFGGIQWAGKLSRTTEADVLITSTLERNGRESLPELLKKHGFRPARKEFYPADWVSADSEATAIEFIVNRDGPFGDSTRFIAGQGSLGALVVERADLFAAFTRTLPVLIAGRSLPVRVPTLGAWAVSKALTFGARRSSASGTVGLEKRAKDLLYIRDLVFAGGIVMEQVESDIAEVAAHPRLRARLSDAVAMLTPVIEAGRNEDVARAGLELATRDGLIESSAIAEIRTAARELREIIDTGRRDGRETR